MKYMLIFFSLSCMGNQTFELTKAHANMLADPWLDEQLTEDAQAFIKDNGKDNQLTLGHLKALLEKEAFARLQKDREKTTLSLAEYNAAFLYLKQDAQALPSQADLDSAISEVFDSLMPIDAQNLETKHPWWKTNLDRVYQSFRELVGLEDPDTALSTEMVKKILLRRQKNDALHFSRCRYYELQELLSGQTLVKEKHIQQLARLEVFRAWDLDRDNNLDITEFMRSLAADYLARNKMAQALKDFQELARDDHLLSLTEFQGVGDDKEILSHAIKTRYPLFYRDLMDVEDLNLATAKAHLEALEKNSLREKQAKKIKAPLFMNYIENRGLLLSNNWEIKNDKPVEKQFPFEANGQKGKKTGPSWFLRILKEYKKNDKDAEAATFSRTDNHDTAALYQMNAALRLDFNTGKLQSLQDQEGTTPPKAQALIPWKLSTGVDFSRNGVGLKKKEIDTYYLSHERNFLHKTDLLTSSKFNLVASFTDHTTYAEGEAQEGETAPIIPVHKEFLTYTLEWVPILEDTILKTNTWQPALGKWQTTCLFRFAYDVMDYQKKPPVKEGEEDTLLDTNFTRVNFTWKAKWSERVNLAYNFTYRHGEQDDSDLHLDEVTLSLNITPTQNYVLTLNYSNGQTPTKPLKAEETILGLGIKF